MPPQGAVHPLAEVAALLQKNSLVSFECGVRSGYMKLHRAASRG
jgi:hypothetical protein